MQLSTCFESYKTIQNHEKQEKHHEISCWEPAPGFFVWIGPFLDTRAAGWSLLGVTISWSLISCRKPESSQCLDADWAKCLVEESVKYRQIPKHPQTKWRFEWSNHLQVESRIRPLSCFSSAHGGSSPVGLSRSNWNDQSSPFLRLNILLFVGQSITTSVCTIGYQAPIIWVWFNSP